MIHPAQHLGPSLYTLETCSEIVCLQAAEGTTVRHGEKSMHINKVDTDFPLTSGLVSSVCHAPHTGISYQLHSSWNLEGIIKGF